MEAERATEAAEAAELRRVPVQVTAGWHRLGSVHPGSAKKTMAGVARMAPASLAMPSPVQAPPSYPAPAPAFAPRPSSPRPPAPAPAYADVDAEFAARLSSAQGGPPPAKAARARVAPAEAPASGGGLLDRVSGLFKRKAKAEPAYEEFESQAGPAFAEAKESVYSAPAEAMYDRDDSGASGSEWYLDLLMQARADGSFPLNQALASAAGVPVERLKAWAKKVELPAGAGTHDSENVLATSLVLVLLKKRAAADEPVWRMAAAKAAAWLAGSKARGAGGRELEDWLASLL